MNENQFVCIGVQQLLSVLHLTCCSFESHTPLLGVNKTLQELMPALGSRGGEGITAGGGIVSRVSIQKKECEILEN